MDNSLYYLKSKKEQNPAIFFFMLNDKHNFMTVFLLLLNIIIFIHEISKNCVLFLSIFSIASVAKRSKQMYLCMPPTRNTNIHNTSGK